jgi:predicted nucleotidyltransferase
MDILQLLKEKKDEIEKIAARHGAYNIRIFGSIARGESNSESDIDLLVSLEKGRSLLDQVAITQDLEDFLGCKVHVLTDGGVHPYLKRRIYAEAVPL